jgi:hypothetical protein
LRRVRALPPHLALAAILTFATPALAKVLPRGLANCAQRIQGQDRENFSANYADEQRILAHEYAELGSAIRDRLDPSGSILLFRTFLDTDNPFRYDEVSFSLSPYISITWVGNPKLIKTEVWIGIAEQNVERNHLRWYKELPEDGHTHWLPLTSESVVRNPARLDEVTVPRDEIGRIVFLPKTEFDQLISRLARDGKTLSLRELAQELRKTPQELP